MMLRLTAVFVCGECQEPEFTLPGKNSQQPWPELGFWEITLISAKPASGPRHACFRFGEHSKELFHDEGDIVGTYDILSHGSDPLGYKATYK